MVRKRSNRKAPPDLTETKAHLFIAGHELLKAAEGVLRYCKYYVESTSECTQHRNMLEILSKGINIAKTLGISMSQEPFIRGAADKVMRGFCDIVEQEIIRERPTKKGNSKKQKTKSKKRKQ